MNSIIVSRMLIASALALAFSCVCAAQTYPVRLDRPWKTGERCRVSGTASSSQTRTITAEGKVLTEDIEGFHAEFVADEAALELGSDGNLTKETLTINNCRVRRGRSTKELFPKRTVVVAALEDGHRVFRVDGQPVEKQVDEVLDMITSMSSTSSARSDDEIFGTAQQRKVGESWSINAAAAVKSLREESKINVSQQDAKGVVTIEKKTPCGNEDCVIISGRMDLDLITMDMDELKVDSGDSQLRFSGAFPVDTSHRQVERSFEMRMRISGTVKPNPKDPEVRIEMKQEYKKTAHYATL